jgi:hypothetical protein
LSIGGVSVFVDRRTAQDVVATLTYALLATVPIDLPSDATPKRGRRRRRPTSPGRGRDANKRES